MLPKEVSVSTYTSSTATAPNFILVFILLVLSGNPAYISQSWAPAGYALVAVVLILVYKKHITKKFLKKIILFLYVFLLIFVLQYFNLGYLSPVFVFGFIIKVLIGALVFEVLGEKFAPTFFNVMVKVCLFSFPFYLIHIYFGDNVLSKFYLESTTQSIGIYTFRPLAPLESFLRNSGMFWEPGAFQAFINLCLFLNFYRMTSLLKEKKLDLLILFIALISTQSTTGYAIFAVLFGIYVIAYSNVSKVLVVVIITLFVGFSVYIYHTLDFLGDKVGMQYELSQETNGEYEPDRLGALIFDLHYIKKNPLSGNGFSAVTTYADHPILRDMVEKGENLGHGNGFSGFIVRAGLLGMFWYLFTLIKFREDRTMKNSIFLCLLMIFLLQGEHFLNFPFFLSLAFFKFNTSDESIFSRTYYLLQ